jgi:hypothetical protein
MNRNTFYLLMLLGTVLTVFGFKFYLNEKQKALKSSTELAEFKQKIDQIVYLQKKYSFKPVKVNFCKIKDTAEKELLVCKNLDKNKFNKLQNIVFKGTYKINKYDIKKHDKYTDVTVEILK